MDVPPSLTLTLGRPDIQLFNTSYNKHAPPSLGSMTMAILQHSDPLNDISYNNEQATSVGSVAMARFQLSDPLNDISYNNEQATSMESVAMVRLQLSDQLTDTSYSYSYEQAPSMGYERGVSQSASDGFSYYAQPPSLTDVADHDESYSVGPGPMEVDNNSASMSEYLDNMLKRTMPWLGEDVSMKNTGLSLVQWMNMQQNQNPSLANQMGSVPQNYGGPQMLTQNNHQFNSLNSQISQQTTSQLEQLQKLPQPATTNPLGVMIQPQQLTDLSQTLTQNQVQSQIQSQNIIQLQQQQQQQQMMMSVSQSQSQQKIQLPSQIPDQQFSRKLQVPESQIQLRQKLLQHQQQQQQMMMSVSQSQQKIQLPSQIPDQQFSRKLQVPESQIQLLQKLHQQQQLLLAQQGQITETPSQPPVSSLPQQMSSFRFSHLPQQPKVQQESPGQMTGPTLMTSNPLSTNGSSLLTGIGSDDVPSCSTSPSTNNCPNVGPSMISGRSYQRTTMGSEVVQASANLINTSGLETLSANGNKQEVKPSVNASKIQNQGFLAPQTYLQQNLGGAQLDYLDSSSSATSVCLSQNDVHLQPHNSNHLSFDSQPLPFRDTIQDGEVQNDPRSDIPFGVNMSSMIPDPLITKGMMGSDKDFQNNLSSAGFYENPIKDTQPELSSSMVSQSFGVPDMTFNSIDSTINDGTLLNNGVWPPPPQPFQRMRTYTKVYKRGAVGRSIDITAYSGYDELKQDLARRFGIEGQLEDRQRIGWKLVYVDHESDVLLVGDDPWEEFVNCVRCIKILSPQEVQQLSLDGDFGGNGVVPNQACSSSGGGQV